MEEDARIGFVFYTNTVTFLRVDSDGDITILRGLDKENPVCPLSFEELFHKVGDDSSTITQIIDYLSQYGTEMYENYLTEMKNQPYCLKSLSKCILDVFDSRGGRAIVFASTHKENQNEIVNYTSKEKVPTFKPKVNTFVDRGL